jgi:transposase, IS5 family
MQQTTFASVAWEKKGKITRRERFLAEMDAVIPWSRLLALIEPHYPKAGNGTQPKPMEQMLRIYFMQNWFNLSDPQAEDSLYDIESMRRFAGIELLGHDIPDETTILRFRHLLEQHQLTERIFAEIRSLLEEKRLLLRVRDDCRCDHHCRAALDEERAEGARSGDAPDEEGKDWHFGMKAHIGTDRHGIVHSLSTTAANVSDITQMPELLHGEEREVFGDQAYWSEAHRKRPGEGHPLPGQPALPSLERVPERFINRRRSAARARVEHVFHVVKRLWGFSKVRYRGLAKNTARLYTAFALANLYLMRRRLLPSQWTYAL